MFRDGEPGEISLGGLLTCCWGRRCDLPRSSLPFIVREKVGEARGRTIDVRGIGEVGLGRAAWGGGVTDNARGGETCPE
jgi:hypothetical protein